MVRDLGVFIDADLSMRTRVQRSLSGSFAVLRQLRSARRSLPSDIPRILVVLLMLSRLDYGNATLAGALAHLLRRLHSVLNAAAGFVADLPRSVHITTIHLQTLIGFVLLSVSNSSWRQLGYVSMSARCCTLLPFCQYSSNR